MAKFRKKPVVIDAVQWQQHGDHPRVKRRPDSASDLWGFIETLEGEMRVIPGDWVITGVAGEVYPCKDEIFKATYEPADAAEPECLWEMDTNAEDDVWHTGCGQEWVFIEGTPAENGVRYCHSCGCKVRFSPAEESRDAADERLMRGEEDA